MTPPDTTKNMQLVTLNETTAKCIQSLKSLYEAAYKKLTSVAEIDSAHISFLQGVNTLCTCAEARLTELEPLLTSGQPINDSLPEECQTLHDIMATLAKHFQTLTADNVSTTFNTIKAALTTELAKRWERIKTTNYAYTYQPRTFISLFCESLASLIDNETRNSLLMPTVTMTEDIHESQFNELALGTFIIAEDGVSFIELSELFRIAYERAKGGMPNVFMYMDAQFEYRDLTDTEKRHIVSVLPSANEFFGLVENIATATVGKGATPLVALQNLAKALEASDRGHAAAELEVEFEHNTDVELLMLIMSAENDDIARKNDLLNHYPRLLDNFKEMHAGKAINTALVEFYLWFNDQPEVIQTQLKALKYGSYSFADILQSLYGDERFNEIEHAQTQGHSLQTLSPGYCTQILDGRTKNIISYHNAALVAMSSNWLSVLYDQLSSLASSIPSDLESMPQTHFWRACREGKLAVVRLLLASNTRINVNAADHNNELPLQLAAKRNDIELVITLINAGAMVERGNPFTVLSLDNILTLLRTTENQTMITWLCERLATTIDAQKAMLVRLAEHFCAYSLSERTQRSTWFRLIALHCRAAMPSMSSLNDARTTQEWQQFSNFLVCSAVKENDETSLEIFLQSGYPYETNRQRTYAYYGHNESPSTDPLTLALDQNKPIIAGILWEHVKSSDLYTTVSEVLYCCTNKAEQHDIYLQIRLDILELGLQKNLDRCFYSDDEEYTLQSLFKKFASTNGENVTARHFELLANFYKKHQSNEKLASVFSMNSILKLILCAENKSFVTYFLSKVIDTDKSKRQILPRLVTSFSFSRPPDKYSSFAYRYSSMSSSVDINEISLSNASLVLSHCSSAIGALTPSFTSNKVFNPDNLKSPDATKKRIKFRNFLLFSSLITGNYETLNVLLAQGCAYFPVLQNQSNNRIYYVEEKGPECPLWWAISHNDLSSTFLLLTHLDQRQSQAHNPALKEYLRSCLTRYLKASVPKNKKLVALLLCAGASCPITRINDELTDLFRLHNLFKGHFNPSFTQITIGAAYCPSIRYFNSAAFNIKPLAALDKVLHQQFKESQQSGELKPEKIKTALLAEFNRHKKEISIETEAQTIKRIKEVIDYLTFLVDLPAQAKHAPMPIPATPVEKEPVETHATKPRHAPARFKYAPFVPYSQIPKEAYSKASRIVYGQQRHYFWPDSYHLPGNTRGQIDDALEKSLTEFEDSGTCYFFSLPGEKLPSATTAKLNDIATQALKLQTQRQKPIKAQLQHALDTQYELTARQRNILNYEVELFLSALFNRKHQEITASMNEDKREQHSSTPPLRISG